jgi:hypothetical protein
MLRPIANGRVAARQLVYRCRLPRDEEIYCYAVQNSSSSFMRLFVCP